MDSNVYIACMGRSGSTLLRQMLDMHPNIIAPPESFFVLHLSAKYSKVTHWTPKIKQHFINDLYTDRPFRLIWDIPVARIQKAMDKASSNMSFVEVTNIVRSCYAPTKGIGGKKIFIDKNPIYSILLKELISADPSAKIIHLVRDPRGVINGQMHSFKRKDIFALGYLWNSRNIKIERISKALNVDYYRIKYDDLIENPAKTISALCKFLDVKYTDDILHYDKNFKNFFSDKTKHYNDKHTSTQKPISKNIAEKWKQNLTKKQLEKIAYTTYEQAKKYGYSIEKSESNFMFLIGLAISKIKVIVMVSVIRAYFNLPLFARKLILYFRSKIFDSRYKINKLENRD